MEPCTTSWLAPLRRRAAELAAARRAVSSGEAAPASRPERDFDLVWSDLDQLREIPFAARESARRRWQGSSRRPVLRTAFGHGIRAALLCVIALAAVLGWTSYRQHVPEWSSHYATENGRQQLVHLPDGSIIQLNVNSNVRVRYFHGRREVVLEAGEVFFSVTRDEARPFEVSAGPVRVRVLGTQFNVRAWPGRVDVAVRSGRVAVFEDGRSIAALDAGQRASFSSAGLEGAVTSVAPDAAGAWTHGWIKLDRVSLSELIDEIGRYRPIAIEVASGAATLRRCDAARERRLSHRRSEWCACHAAQGASGDRDIEAGRKLCDPICWNWHVIRSGTRF